MKGSSSTVVLDPEFTLDSVAGLLKIPVPGPDLHDCWRKLRITV